MPLTPAFTSLTEIVKRDTPTVVRKYNPYHDVNGRFATSSAATDAGGGGGQSASARIAGWTRQEHAMNPEPSSKVVPGHGTMEWEAIKARANVQTTGPFSTAAQALMDPLMAARREEWSAGVRTRLNGLTNESAAGKALGVNSLAKPPTVKDMLADFDYPPGKYITEANRAEFNRSSVRHRR